MEEIDDGSYSEIIVQTPIPDMIAALVSGAFIKAGVPVWLKPDTAQSIKVCFPKIQAERAFELFNGLKKSAKKIHHEKPLIHHRGLSNGL